MTEAEKAIVLDEAVLRVLNCLALWTPESELTRELKDTLVLELPRIIRGGNV
jgi:hypothetical protein